MNNLRLNQSCLGCQLKMFKQLLYIFIGVVALVTAMPQEGAYRHGLFMNYAAKNGNYSDDFMEDGNLTVMQLIDKYGYQGEEHKVQTDDGYILTIHRILPKSSCTTTRRPVILQHGLLSSSADWIIIGPQNALGYLLADACHDVWMGNSRGNIESREHAYLDTHSDEYWDFSWHEMAVHDLPSVIDYVLAKTGYDQVHYVGHSQGTTQYFIMDSLKPEYAKKVKVMFALAPIAFMGNSESSLLQFIAHFQGVLGDLLDLLGVNEFLPGGGFLSQFTSGNCDEEHPGLESMCENVLFIICGFDPEQTNTTTLPVIMSHVPAGAATKQLLHYAQSLNSGLFRMYDYGNSKNKEIYGQKDPPAYPLENAKSEYALFYCDNDLLANIKDVNILFNNLNNTIGKFHVAWEKFNHLDYLWAIDVKTLVYDKVLDIMSRE